MVRDPKGLPDRSIVEGASLFAPWARDLDEFRSKNLVNMLDSLDRGKIDWSYLLKAKTLVDWDKLEALAVKYQVPLKDLAKNYWILLGRTDSEIGSFYQGDGKRAHSRKGPRGYDGDI